MSIKFNPLIFSGLDLAGGAGITTWMPTVPDEASLPLSGNADGDTRVTLDTDKIYIWDATTSRWEDQQLTLAAAIGSNPNSRGYNFATDTSVPGIRHNQLILEPADGSNPGILSTGSQTIAGDKTMNGFLQLPSNGLAVGTTDLVFGANQISTALIPRINPNSFGSSYINFNGISGIGIDNAGFANIVPNQLLLASTTGQSINFSNDFSNISFSISSTQVTTSRNLLPSGNNLQALGGPVNAFSDAYFKQLKDGNDSLILSVDDRFFYDNQGYLSLDFQSRLLFDSAENNSIDYESRQLFDSSGNQSVNYDARQLVNSSGSAVLDFSGTNLDAQAVRITNVAAPVSPNDAVTKTYTDSTFVPLTEKGAALGVATLDGGGKVPVSQLPNSIMQYKGVYNAATNTPTLVDGASNPDSAIGDVYRVSVAGTQDFGSGLISFEVGDYVILNDAKVWEKSDTTDAVASVNGKTGIVTLNADDVGAANQSLSNLTTTAINTALIPDSDDNYNFGSFSQRWSNVYAYGILFNSGGPQVAMSTGRLVASGYIDSIDWDNRQLVSAAGDILLQWSGTNLDANAREVVNLLDPTLAQSAATKNYVDQALSTVPTKSVGDINETTFNISANQVVAANVTGLVFAAGTVRSAKVTYSITIDATTDLFEAGELMIINRNGSFDLVQNWNFDNSGVLFTITPAGQIQYTSASYSGFVSGVIKFRAITTTV